MMGFNLLHRGKDTHDMHMLGKVYMQTLEMSCVFIDPME